MYGIVCMCICHDMLMTLYKDKDVHVWAMNIVKTCLQSMGEGEIRGKGLS